MEEIISRLVGSKVDVGFGTTAIIRGEVRSVENGVINMIDENDTPVYIAIDKIATVYECSDNTTRPGFIG